MKQRLQRWLISRMRRSRFLPVSVPDKFADKDRLEKPFSQSVLVYFGTGQDTLYQLRQWLKPFESLDQQHPVILVFQDSRTASVVRRETDLECVTLATHGQLDAILAQSNVKLALYVNNHPANFEILRFTSLLHIYLGHGESDKHVFVSNQIKAYDRYFVAGQAAVDRVSRAVMFYDAGTRCIMIGQPQLDRDRPRSFHPTARPVVLYAPTWEGAQPSVAYSSIISHGAALVDSILDSDSFDLIYRPHPLTGAVDPAYREADAVLRKKVFEAGQQVDTVRPLGDSIADAAILVTDVSAVTSFWLPTSRPILVTEPASPSTQKDPESISASLPRLTAVDARGAETIITALLETSPNYDEMIQHHLGDIAYGAATARFIGACSVAIADRDEAQSKLS